MKTALLLCLFPFFPACSIISGSAVSAGNSRPATSPEAVKVYFSPPAKFETLAILSTNGIKSMFSTEQAFMDGMIARLKQDAAKQGANGVLLTGMSDQQAGSISQGIGNSYAFTNANASAYGFGNGVNAFGQATTNTMLNTTMINTPIIKKVMSATAIYVK